jgi:hypothetical protein
MIRPYAISALATVIISILAVSVIIPAPASDEAKHFGSSHGHLYQLSPIPAGADWARS